MKQKHHDFLAQASRSYQTLQTELDALNNQQNHYHHAMQAAIYRAKAFDKIIDMLYEDIPDLQFTIVAIGGYGRGRLAPYSDIDLLFIHASHVDIAITKPLMERCLYVLWDLHIKVGYKIGTADEIMETIFDDIIATTAFIDRRFISGNRAIYDDFVTFVTTQMAKKMPRKKFIAAKILETKNRHLKQGATRYLLEPNIKEGRGALRDLDMLYWVCSYQAETNVTNPLRDILGEKLYHDYQLLESFLWNVRFLIHHISGRAGETLTLDLQSEIAEKLGYRLQENNIGKRVERFMRHYFLNVRKVGFLARTVVAEIELSENRKTFALSQTSYKEVEGFHRQGRFLSFSHQDMPKIQPLAMLTIFIVAMKYNLRLHPQALRALIVHRNLLGSYRDDKDANQLFVKILTQGKKGVWALKRMNETGIMAIFVPAFRNIVAQMQFNRYHYYTTDIHTFNALNILATIEQGELRSDLPVISGLARDKNYRRKLLYCALFLHDIGKGQKEHHSIVGEKVAEKLCLRLGFDLEETTLIAWLVRHHLVMSDTAFKRDLLDRRTIADFASLVENQEKLQLLYMLTVIDIKAVSPVSWNSYKDTLLNNLYARTYDMLSQQARFGYYLDDEDAVARAKIVEELSDSKILSTSQAEDYVRSLPENYLKAYTTEDIIRHAQIIVGLEQKLSLQETAPYDKKLFHLSIRQEDNINHLRIGFIVKWNPQCFTDCAAIVAFAGGDTYQANLFRVNSQYVVIYFVSHFVNIERAEEILPEIAEDILSGDKIRYREHINNLNYRIAQKPKGNDKQYIANDSIVKHGEVKFYLNISDLYTVIELSARDRQGLLYQIVQTLSEEHVQINAAKIATFGEEVVDSFYVKDAFGFKIEQPKMLEKIRVKLQDVLRK